MKYILTFLFLLNCSVLNLSSGNQETYVYICTGKYAYSYHSNRSCSGLNNCKSEIKRVTIESAIKMHRTQCDKCYH